jgi:hypothetical protein
MRFVSAEQRQAVFASLKQRAQAGGRRLKLATYRHPYSHQALKRALFIGGLTVALGLKSRRLARAAVKTHRRLVKAHVDLRDLTRNPFPHDRLFRYIMKRRRYKVRMQALRKRQSLRADRYGKAAKIAGIGGSVYAAMPLAAYRGMQKDLERQRAAYPVVTVIEKRGDRVVRVRQIT